MERASKELNKNDYTKLPIDEFSEILDYVIQSGRGSNRSNMSSDQEVQEEEKDFNASFMSSEPPKPPAYMLKNLSHDNTAENPRNVVVNSRNHELYIMTMFKPPLLRVTE